MRLYQLEDLMIDLDSINAVSSLEFQKDYMRNVFMFIINGLQINHYPASKDIYEDFVRAWKGESLIEINEEKKGKKRRK